MLLLSIFLGCGKKPAIPDSGVRSAASIGEVLLLEGNYGIENSPSCSVQIPPVVKQSIGQITGCHDAVLRTKPNANGTLTLETKVVHGRVMSAKTSSNGTGDSGVASCIEGVAKQWKFASECTAMASVSFNLNAQE